MRNQNSAVKKENTYFIEVSFWLENIFRDVVPLEPESYMSILPFHDKTE